jgi:hypothetical protein
VNARFECLNGILLVLNWAGRAGKVKDSINLNVERESNIMANQLKLRVIQKMSDVLLAPCVKIVGNYNFVANFEQSISQMGA